MRLDRALAEHEPRGDRTVAASLGDEPEHLQLACGQLIHPRELAACGFQCDNRAVDFRILGPLEVVDDGAALALGGSKQRALLALLVLHANETLSAGRLIDELWGERPPVTATKALRVHVSRLRRTLTEPVLVTRGSGYRERFRGQHMVALYRSGRQADALQAYRDARDALVGDLGIDPGEHLRELERAVLAQDPALAAPAAAAYEPPAAHPLPRALHLPAGAAFAGRERELAQLREAWGRVAEGGSAAVLLVGEAGIGKTRLAAELAAGVHRAGGSVLYGRCDEGLAVPYQPFAEALGSRFAEAADQLALFAATAACLDGHALVLDDLHWATAPTLHMLRHVIRAEPHALILGTYRDTELEPGHLLRTLPAERIELNGLDEPAIASLLAAAGASAPGAPARLLAQTNGNPFFVRELIAHPGEPAPLRDVIARRVARLSPEGQRLLTAAAVAGTEFSVTVVEHALGPDADALDALDEATAAGLLTERGHGDYAFTRALVRQTIYAGLTSTRRARLHWAIGEALEATEGCPRRGTRPSLRRGRRRRRQGRRLRAGGGPRRDRPARLRGGGRPSAARPACGRPAPPAPSRARARAAPDALRADA